MQHDDQELQQLWQSIETPAEINIEEIMEKARKQKRASICWLVGDTLGTLLCAAVLVMLFFKDVAPASIALFAVVTGFCGYLTYKSYKLRIQGLNHVTENTCDHHQYLQQRANGQIKLGKLFINATYWSTAGLIAFFASEYLHHGEGVWESPKQFVFMLLWCSACFGFCYYYGRSKLRQGQSTLDNLKETA